MPSQDARGLAVSTADPAALEAIDHFATDLLSMGPDTARLLEAADQHPECALLQTYAGVLHLYAMKSSEGAVANALLQQARELGGNPRERALLGAAQAWHDGDYESAMERCEDITRQWPRDVVAAKIAEFNYFLGGQHWNGYRFAAHLQRIIHANDDNPYLLGMYAFSQELAGNLDECRASAERATERERRNPWAHHALAHFYTRRGDAAGGIAFLEDLTDTWHASGSAIRVHNYWHLALLYLDQCDTRTVRRLFDEEVFVRDRDVVGTQIDAMALLWRLEMAGESLPSTVWETVIAACEPRAGDFTIPYVAAHYAYAFARSGREDALAKTREKAARLADETQGHRQIAWRSIGIPLLEGCIAFAEGDMKRAAAELGPLMTDVPRAGGSDAQVDLFRQTNLLATRRAGDRSRARELWKDRVGERRPTSLEELWRAEMD